MRPIPFKREMTRLVVAFMFWGGLGLGMAPAQDAIAPSDHTAIRSVIEAQIAAFRRDDGVAAFSLASPSIQGIFGTPGQFMEMVRSGYQPVYRPRSVNFQNPSATQSGWDQPVVVVGPDGRAYLALYSMQRQGNGSWRINGCRLLLLVEESV